MMGPKEKKERSLGEHLQLKAYRSQTDKSAMVRRPYRPGAHGKNSRPKALSDFGKQLKEKQKFKLVYGLDDRNLRALFNEASRSAGSVGTRLLELFESRLDNVLFRMGFAPSRIMGRQMVLHGHITVNGRKVYSPGRQMRPKDVIRVREESRTRTHFKNLPEAMKSFSAPAWLLVDFTKLEGSVLGAPETSDIPFEINLIVESFSR
jgi:small subunit ribosomal protein S4